MIYSTDLLYKPTPKYAHGGDVRTTMQEVHVNPEEVHHMDHLQGGPKFTATGKRSYKELGKLFKNPHIEGLYHEHVAEHRANGGAIGRHEHPHAAAENGRYGDTEVVEMPHHLVHIMNKAQGGACYNPWDGKPEYFLGGLFSSLASKLGPMLGSAARGIGGMFSRGAGALSRGASAVASKLPTMAAVKSGLGSAASTAGKAASAILPAYMQHKQMQQMQRMNQPPQAMGQEGSSDDEYHDARPLPKYESLPDDLYGGMANSPQLRAAKRVTGGVRVDAPGSRTVNGLPY